MRVTPTLTNQQCRGDPQRKVVDCDLKDYEAKHHNKLLSVIMKPKIRYKIHKLFKYPLKRKKFLVSKYKRWMTSQRCYFRSMNPANQTRNLSLTTSKSQTFRLTSLSQRLKKIKPRWKLVSSLKIQLATSSRLTMTITQCGLYHSKSKM